jgi:ATP-dependent Lon protease
LFFCFVTFVEKQLSTLEPSGSEFNVTRTYLDWLTQLPWGKFQVENLELEHARKAREQTNAGA